MKKATLFVVWLLCLCTYSQNTKNYNQFSLEASYGLNHPLTPKDNSGFDVSTFSEFKHVDIGGRYMFNQYYGVKLSVAYDRFQYENTSQLAVTYYKISAEAVFNLAQIMNFSFNRRRNFQIQTHTGLGITFAQPKSVEGYEKIGNFIIGLTPQLKLSDRVGLTTDLSYNYIFKQHFDYGGILIDPDYEASSGSFINFTIGIQLYLGADRHHADWF